MSQKQQQHPLLLSVIGLFFIIFGIIDILFVHVAVGAGLLVVGLVMGVIGLNRWRRSKKAG